MSHHRRRFCFALNILNFCPYKTLLFCLFLAFPLFFLCLCIVPVPVNFITVFILIYQLPPLFLQLPLFFEISSLPPIFFSSLRFLPFTFLIFPSVHSYNDIKKIPKYINCQLNRIFENWNARSDEKKKSNFIVYLKRPSIWKEFDNSRLCT